MLFAVLRKTRVGVVFQKVFFHMVCLISLEVLHSSVLWMGMKSARERPQPYEGEQRGGGE